MYPAEFWDTDKLFTSSHVLCPLGTFTLSAFAGEALTSIPNSWVTINVNDITINPSNFPNELAQYKLNLDCKSTGLNGQSGTTVILLQMTKKACLVDGKPNSADALYSTVGYKISST